MREDQFVLQMRGAQRLDHRPRHERQHLLGDRKSDERAQQNCRRGVNDARAQLAQMLEERHLAAVFGVSESAGGVRRDGGRHRQVFRVCCFGRRHFGRGQFGSNRTATYLIGSFFN